MPQLALSLFSLSLFVSASLLFCVEPMVAKMLLPLLGGTPAVWNTCLFFFQVFLLLGYLYADLGFRLLGLRRQLLLHLVLLGLGLLFLPIGFPSVSLGTSPVAESFWLLLRVVGLPFFLLSASAPLLQRWVACTSLPSAKDPYYLYQASNIGSLLALFVYPLLLEPKLGLGSQSTYWQWGYVLLVGLFVLCALWMQGAVAETEPVVQRAPEWRRQWRWVLWGFVPSSFLLGTTTRLTTDIAAMPLLWTLPLALYLLSFVLVFAKKPVLSLEKTSRVLASVVVLTLLFVLCEIGQPIWLVFFLHLLCLFFVAMLCHGALSADRPEASQLTRFYVCMSLGGALGGLFNALLVPLLFDSLAEYTIVLLLACLLRPRDARESALGRAELFWMFGLAALVLGLKFVLGSVALLPSRAHDKLAVITLALLVLYSQLERTRRFALGLAAIAGAAAMWPTSQVVLQERNFFGLLRVVRDDAGRLFQVVHGNTVHGAQFVDAAKSQEPLVYYHRKGPLGDVFSLFHAQPRTGQIGVVGLGIGTTAAYAQADESWVFFEINTAMAALAEETSYFRYLSQARQKGAKIRVVLGDARQRLAEEAPGSYQMLLLDAFSSDGIPTHLLTREALSLYRRLLRPEGLLAFHISNRYLHLQPVLRGLGDAEGLLQLCREDVAYTEEESVRDGVAPSIWCVMAQDKATIAALREKSWASVEAPEILWTDDFSSLVPLLW